MTRFEMFEVCETYRFLREGAIILRYADRNSDDFADALIAALSPLLLRWHGAKLPDYLDEETVNKLAVALETFRDEPNADSLHEIRLAAENLEHSTRKTYEWVRNHREG